MSIRRNRSGRRGPATPTKLLLSVLVIVAVALVTAGSTLARTTNLVQLDDGTCGKNLQIGSDKTASSSATPQFLLWGDGGASSYQMFIDGTSIGTFASDGWGNVCIYTTVPLADGPHTLTGIELTPHNTLTPTPLNFSVDTVPPATPTPPVISGYSDSGVAGDHITMYRNVNFTGTSDPLVSVQLYNGPTGIAGAKADATGHWSATTSALNDGNYVVTAAAFDEAGNKSPLSTSFNLTVDGTAPTGPITTPADGSTVSGTTNVTVNAADAVGVLKVDFKVDGVVKSTATGAPWTYAWNTNSVANGSHTLNTVTTDYAGNTTTSTATVNVQNGVAATVPAAPTPGSTTGGNGSVALSWAAPSSDGGSAITGYKIYRGTTSGSEAALASVGNVTSYTDTTAANGTTYYYKVSALNAIGESALSTETSATPATVPGAPTLGSATGGNASVALAWTAPGSNGGSAITGYNVYRGTAAGGETLLASVGTGTTYTDSTAANGTTYFYVVSAVNSRGESVKSNELSATPAAPLTAPGAPTLAPAVAGDHSVALMWTAPASNGGSPVTGYTVYRGTVSGSLTQIATTVSVATGYTDTTALNGTTYYYAVTATNLVGEGAKSAERSATPAATATAPGAPTLNAPATGDGSVALTWSAPSSDGGSAITGYRVYRGTTSGSETLLTTVGAGTTFNDTGLTNGTAYFYKVSAVNGVGEGAQSNERSATPATTPGAPTLNTASAGNASVTLAWSAPSSNGGSAVTAYTATASPGGATCTTGTLGCTISGLTNGTTYSFTVKATNAVGTGAASNTLGATPATTPGAPTLASATSGDSAVALTWSAPASNGGSAITGYTVAASPGGATCTTATLGCTISGLTNGTAYTFTVKATNAVGTGAASNSLSATPAATPGAPTLTATAAGNGSVALSWTAPASNGGSAVTGYRVYRGTSTGAETLFTTLGTGTSWTDTSTANGTTYYYTVSALNTVGEGPVSNEKSATPATVPGAPSLDSATAGNGSVALSWTAPGSTGGSALGGYRVYRGTTSGTETLLTTVGTVTTYNDTTTANGTTYYYTVSALNSSGEGLPSNERSATPATTPGAPTLTAATAGNGTVALTWTAPSSNGGSAITGYTATAAPGGATCSAGTLGCTISGLTNGTTYTLTVKATNAAGTGNASNSLTATPATTPGAPTLASATGGDGTVALTWTAPVSNGGSAITSYTATASPGGANCVTTAAPFCTIGGLTNGTAYTFTVKATNAVGTGPVSNSLSATPATTPSAPALASPVAGDGTVALSWTAPTSTGGSAVTGYKVYRGTTSGGETLLTTVGTGTTYTDTSLTNGTTYFYKVSAVNALGEGTQSGERSATPAVTPGAPTLTATTGGNGNVALTWTAPVSNGGSALTGYRVYRGITSGSETLLTTVGTVTSYNDATAVNGTAYFYEVSAVNGVGEGLPSNERSATPATTPGAPTLTAAAAGNNSVALTWTAPASNGGSAVTGYRVYRGTSTGAETFFTTVGTGTSWTDTSTANGTSYYYEVSAVNALGEGQLSNEKSTTPATVPGAPSLDSATAGNGSVALSWTAPSSTGGSAISGYRVYRGTASGGEALLTTLGTVTTYADTTAANGTTYYYTVSALNGSGEGVPSNERSAMPATTPGAPTLTAATAGNGTVALTWTAPSSNGGSAVTGYTAIASPGGATCSTGTLGCTISGLTNGTTYTFTVRATNAVGAGTASNSLTATPATTPGAPALTAAAGGNGSVALTWTAPVSNGGSSVTGYRVYRSTTSGGETLLTTVGTGTSWTDTGAANGTTYYYEVSAVNAVGEGTLSNERSATPATVPGAPTLTTASAGSNSVALAWTAPASNGGSAVTGYRVYRGTTSGSETLLTTVGTVTSYNDATAVNGTTYFYKVSALNSVGESVPSNESSATPATTPGTPNLTAATGGNNSVALTWTAPATNGGSAVTGYRVYRGTTSGSETLLTTVGAATTFTDTTAVNGTTYFYEVSAVNSVGEGLPSNERSATPATMPGAPNLTAATGGSNSVALTWSAPATTGGSTITGYRVYRSMTSGNETLLTTVGTATTYTDATAVNGTTYFYKVSAVNAVGEGLPSNEGSATPATMPGAPNLTAATAGNNSVALTWTAPATNGGSAVTGYRVYRGTTSGNETLLTTVGTVTTYTDATAVNGTSYYYTVSAVNALGEGLPSAERSATPSGVVAPAAPTLNSATPGNSVTLVWSAPQTDGGSPVTGYNIYRSTTSGAETFLISVGNVTTYTDETTTGGTTYYFQVSAVNAAGESARSGELSATPPVKDTTAPSRPGGLKIPVAGTTQVTLSWSASTDNVGVTGYQVYRDGTLVGTASGLNYLDSGLAPGSSHSYTVRAVDAAGNASQSSSSVSARLARQGSGSGVLSGVVFNAGGSILRNANVTLTMQNGTVKTTKTGNNGVWQLSSMPAGTYTVTVSLGGYPTRTTTMTAVNGQTVVGITTLS